jgi:hypothetical protein
VPNGRERSILIWGCTGSGATDILLFYKECLPFIQEMADIPAPAFECSPSTFLSPRFDGHILLTTQAQAIGSLARRLDIPPLPPDAGALFLLRRAVLIEPSAQLVEAAPTDITLARDICKELGGLPLALDQAGAYRDRARVCATIYHKPIDPLSKAIEAMTGEEETALANA